MKDRAVPLVTYNGIVNSCKTMCMCQYTRLYIP